MKSWPEFREAINAEMLKRREQGKPEGTHYGLAKLTGLRISTIDSALELGDSVQWGTLCTILQGLGLSFRWVHEQMKATTNKG